MTKNYRAIQQWNHWLSEPLGSRLLEEEQKFLLPFLEKYYGKYALLIGVQQQEILLQSSLISYPVLLSPLINKTKIQHYIESNLYELPVASGSINLVLLPHTLEYVDNPRQLLNEACRIVQPEGHIVIFGFNSFSLWGLKKWLAKSKHIPWSGNFIPASTIKQWLQLDDFELTEQSTLLFRPPIQKQSLYEKLKCMEWIGRKCYAPLGGSYVLIAKAKVIPLTPIKLHWKQKLSAVSVSAIPKPSIRDRS